MGVFFSEHSVYYNTPLCGKNTPIGFILIFVEIWEICGLSGANKPSNHLPVFLKRINYGHYYIHQDAS